MPGWGLTIRALLPGFIGYYISSLLDFEGLVYITAQLERLVLFTYPIFVMFLGWLFFGARLTWIEHSGGGHNLRWPRRGVSHRPANGRHGNGHRHRSRAWVAP